MRVNRARLGLALLMLPTFVVALDTTALILALPHLAAALGASSTAQLWISDSYGFTVAGLVITMGTLGDRIGRRRLLLGGAAAFAVLSVLAALSVSPLMLIIVRALLGAAGATLAPAVLALISNLFRDDRERGQAIAVWAAAQFAGGALGPVLAGVLLQYFWWGSVCLIPVPAMMLLLAAGPFLLPESRGANAGRLDPASAALSLAAVLLAVYGVKQLAAGSSPLVPAAALISGAAAGLVFTRRQLRLPVPLLDLRLLRARPVAAVLIALVFAGVAMAGTGLLVTQYLQEVLGYPPAAAALLFTPMGLGVAAGTMTAPALARRVTPATAIAGGLACSALGGLLLACAGGLPLVLAGITVLALGTGPLFALGTGLVIGSVPPGRAGSAASMSETGNYLGGSLGFALLGALAAAVYRNRTGGASDSVAGAVAASRRLPAGPAADLLHAARAAFTASLHVTGAVTVIIFAALAVLVLALRAPAGPGPTSSSATATRSTPRPAAASAPARPDGT